MNGYSPILHRVYDNDKKSWIQHPCFSSDGKVIMLPDLESIVVMPGTIMQGESGDLKIYVNDILEVFKNYILTDTLTEQEGEARETVKVLVVWSSHGFDYEAIGRGEKTFFPGIIKCVLGNSIDSPKLLEK